MTPPTNGTPAAEHSHEDVRTSTVDAAVTLAKSFGLFRWLITAAAVFVGGLIITGAEAWTQDQVTKTAAPLIKQAQKDHAQIHTAAATEMADALRNLTARLPTETDKAEAKARAAQADQVTAILLCYSLPKTDIKGSHCVLRRKRGRPKKTIDLQDTAALLREVLTQ